MEYVWGFDLPVNMRSPIFPPPPPVIKPCTCREKVSRMKSRVRNLESQMNSSATALQESIRRRISAELMTVQDRVEAVMDLRLHMLVENRMKVLEKQMDRLVDANLKLMYEKLNILEEGISDITGQDKEKNKEADTSEQNQLSEQTHKDGGEEHVKEEEVDISVEAPESSLVKNDFKLLP